MPKMKEMDLLNVGGRIRKARTDAALTTKVLSKRIGVSLVYLGMVERGERNPSDKILVSIADTTGVPIDWLKNGGRIDDKMKKADSLQSFRDIDAALFLGIIMREKPPMSAETIAAVLNIDQDTLKSILDGTLKCDPAWESAFTSFAERLEIPEILNKLRRVESFFTRVDIKKCERTLITAIESSLSEKCHDEVTYLEPAADQEDCDIRKARRYSDFPIKSFFFKQKSTSTRMEVAFYAELREDQLGNLLFSITTYAQANCDNVENVLAFIDEKNFRDALSYSEKRKNDANYVPKVIAMHLDLMSRSVANCELI